MVLDLHREVSFPHEEELPSLRMKMTLFSSPRWHQLFDNAQFCRLDQMPTVAICAVRATPLVVFSSFCTFDLCRYGSTSAIFLFNSHGHRRLFVTHQGLPTTLSLLS